MSNIVFYAGSFDPFTNGHLQVVRIASKTFKQVIVGIGTNPNKTPRFSKEDMKTAIEDSLREAKLNNVKTIIYDGETWKTAKENGCNILIRGIRNEIDYRYEEEIANYNDKYGIETIYLRAFGCGKISSSFVYQEFLENKDISEYVPLPVKKLIMRKSKYM